MISTAIGLNLLLSGNGGSYIMPDEYAMLEQKGVLSTRTFSQTMASSFNLAANSDIFFWQRGERSCLKRLLPPHTQAFKDCTSHAWAVALQDWTLCCFGSWWGEISTEALYGGSRVQIGAGRLKQPGSCCAWVAAFVVKYGILPRNVYGEYDLSVYNPDLVSSLGQTGIPPILMPNFKRLPEKLTLEVEAVRVAKLTSGQQAWDAVQYYSPIAFASKLGFQTIRGLNGICEPEGIWNHSMVVRGRCTVKGGRQCLVIQNSVGDYLGDINQTVNLESEGDMLLKLPPGVFLMDLEVFDGICRNEDAYAVF
jgi:hypothetical protein